MVEASTLSVYKPEENADAVETVGNIRVERFTDRNGRPAAKAFRISTGKQLHYFYFRSVDNRETWVRDLLNGEQRRLDNRKLREQAAKTLRDSFENPVQVGDLFYTSWGYDQTNVNFYQCVAVGPKSITLREVAQDANENGFMSGTTAAIKDDFCGEPFMVRVVIRAGYDGKAYHYWPAKHSNYSEWDGHRVHYSYYA